MFKQEIERKWIVNLGAIKDLDKYHSTRIIQGYLSQEMDSLTVRVRSLDGYAFQLTIKDSGLKIRNEMTYKISEEEFDASLALSGNKVIEKRRYYIPSSYDADKMIEVDVFKDFGFAIAEYEGESELDVDTFIAEEWFVKEVTNDQKYQNSYLAYNKKSIE